jgi:hypothetical protein
VGSSRRSSRRRAESVLFVRQQQAINALHPFPVVFVGSSTDETDLVMLAIAVESWPTKLMGAQIAKESLKESHVCCPLPRGAKLGGATCSEKWRVNRFDSYSGILSNYGSASEVRVTALLEEFGTLDCRRMALAREFRFSCGSAMSSWLRVSVAEHSDLAGRSYLDHSAT